MWFHALFHLILTNLHLTDGVEAQSFGNLLNIRQLLRSRVETWTTNSLLLNSTLHYSQLPPWWFDHLFILLSRLRTLPVMTQPLLQEAALLRAADRAGLRQQHLLSHNSIPSCTPRWLDQSRHLPIDSYPKGWPGTKDVTWGKKMSGAKWMLF